MNTTCRTASNWFNRVRPGLGLRAVAVLVALVGVSGCALMPHDGPSSHAFKRPKEGTPSYALVQLDYAVTKQISDHPPAALTGLANQASDARNDLIEDGDALSVSIFEPGESGLFGGAAQPTSANSPQTLARSIVDQSGDLTVPFAGEVHVAGLAPREASAAIRRALRGVAVDPQVTLSVLDSRANSVSVLGEVRTAGHFLLSAHNDRLIDVIATAGGPTKPPADLVVVVSRNGLEARVPLTVLLRDANQNIRLAPQDQIRVLNTPRKYDTFGALLRDTQTSIDDDTMSLADALSRAGGLDTNTADARWVMVFRFERPEVAAALGVTRPPTAKGVPIVYRLNLRNPEGFFVASNFEIQAGDLLYVPRSDISEAYKFFQLVDSVTQLTYNVTATSSVANSIP